MERQLDFFGGITEQLAQGTPALDNAYYQPEVDGAERGHIWGHQDFGVKINIFKSICYVSNRIPSAPPFHP